MRYIIIVCSCTLILSAILTLVCEVEFLYALGFTTLAVVAIVALDGLVAGVARMLPKKFADREKKIFHVSAKEKSFYEKLKIRKWKDRMPDMSRVMADMVPKQLGKCPKSSDAWRLVQETCRAEIVHWGLCLCAPVIYFFWWNWIGVCLSCLTVLCNLPFVLIQRYNRPALVRLAVRLELREERKKCKC